MVDWIDADGGGGKTYAGSQVQFIYRFVRQNACVKANKFSINSKLKHEPTQPRASLSENQPTNNFHATSSKYIKIKNSLA